MLRMGRDHDNGPRMCRTCQTLRNIDGADAEVKHRVGTGVGTACAIRTVATRLTR